LKLTGARNPTLRRPASPPGPPTAAHQNAAADWTPAHVHA